MLGVHVRGPLDGEAVTMLGDFACPRCAVAARDLAAQGARVTFRHLALKAKHPRTVATARAAEAAGLQDGFWAFHDALYADQGRLDDPHLWARCEALGIDVARFEADRRSDAVIEVVQRQTREAIRAGAMSTPTLLRDATA